VFESEADRLGLIQAVGGERFDTGNADKLWAIFEREYLQTEVGVQSVANRRPTLTCRSSDVIAHSLVKDSKVVRDSDGSTFFCSKFEPDGTGMTLVMLRA
jgi:hypothetical protein